MRHLEARKLHETSKISVFLLTIGFRGTPFTFRSIKWQPLGVQEKASPFQNLETQGYNIHQFGKKFQNFALRERGGLGSKFQNFLDLRYIRYIIYFSHNSKSFFLFLRCDPPKLAPTQGGGAGKKFAEDMLKKSAYAYRIPTHPISLLFSRKNRYIFDRPPLIFQYFSFFQYQNGHLPTVSN